VREELTVKVFENKALRELCECKREELAGGWRKLHNEELPNWYSSPDIVRVTKSKWTAERQPCESD
jgi:redox-regulated HSP33 family molecular chaperone